MPPLLAEVVVVAPLDVEVVDPPVPPAVPPWPLLVLPAAAPPAPARLPVSP